LKTRPEMGRLENPDRPAYHLRKQYFLRKTYTRFRIMVAGRANHRSDRDVPRASLYPAPGTVQYSQNV
jgi:hypothetical protein